MSSSSNPIPAIVENVSRLNIEKLINDASQKAPSHHPLVVFIGFLKLPPQLIEELLFPYFQTQTLHEFFRLGLNQYQCVIVLDEIRAECSLKNLNKLIAKRSNGAFEVISRQKNSTTNLTVEINQACSRVRHLSAIEDSIATTTAQILNQLDSDNTPSDEGRSIHQSKDFKTTQSLLSNRVMEHMREKPEKFLKNAISEIRKDQK